MVWTLKALSFVVLVWFPRKQTLLPNDHFYTSQSNLTHHAHQTTMPNVFNILHCHAACLKVKFILKWHVASVISAVNFDHLVSSHCQVLRSLQTSPTTDNDHISTRPGSRQCSPADNCQLRRWAKTWPWSDFCRDITEFNHMWFPICCKILFELLLIDS